MNLQNGFNSHSGEADSHIIFLLVTGILLALMIFVGGGVLIFMRNQGMFIR